MGKKLTINKLKKDAILKPSFEELKSNNSIEFSKQGIAVVYAPNGTGKTTITKIMKNEDNTEIEVEFVGESYDSENINSLFHVISDQISRNIIAGNTDEFILGENIAKERQTKASLDKEFQTLIDSIKDILKKEFNIAKQATPFIDSISDEAIKNIVSIVGRRGSQYSDVDLEGFIEKFTSVGIFSVEEYEEERLKFYLEDTSDKAKSSKICLISEISLQNIDKTETIRTVERNSTAISVLQKYCELPYCVVCDAQDIDPIDLLEKKKKSTNEVYSLLSSDNKKMLDKIVSGITEDDPFNIKTS